MDERVNVFFIKFQISRVMDDGSLGSVARLHGLVPLIDQIVHGIFPVGGTFLLWSGGGHSTSAGCDQDWISQSRTHRAHHLVDQIVPVRGSAHTIVNAWSFGL